MPKTLLPPNAFMSAELKVERAYQHIKELQSTISRIKTHLAQQGPIRHQGNGTFELGWSDVGPAGAFVPYIIGDAIHNLRAACDHVWGVMSRAAEPDRAHASRVKFATFPFGQRRNDFETSLKEGAVQKAFPDVADLILEKIKPYSEGGNHRLWTLTKYDKIDKHNAIIPTVTVNHIGYAAISFDGGAPNIIRNVTSTGGPGIIFLNPGGTLKVQGNADFTVEIAFPKDDFLPGQPVVPALLNMAEATANVVKLFRETFTTQ